MDKRQPKLRLLHAIFVFVAVVSIGMILGMAAKVWAAPIGKPLTADTKALTGGSYYLNGDIELNDILEVTGASTLDLNGHVLSVKEGGVGIRVKANFTINDSNRTTTHKFKKIEKDAWKWDETTGDVEIHGGVITGAKNKVTGNSYSTAGGAISVVEDNVTVTMNGGNIVGNKLTDEGGRGNAGHGGAAFGMGIECPHGKFIMKGGTIQGNATITSTAAAQGGAIWSFGTVEISGYNTNISYNTADRADTNTKTASGGAIFVQNENSSLSITGSVKLSDNYAKDQGGAILNAGTATLKGTVIENCKSDGSAGAILNLKDLTLDNATKIKNCTAKNFGGAISNTDENAVVTLGAGIAFENCKTTATATEANPGVGGAIFNMGSIINDSDSLLSFKQCSAGYGGGAIYTFKKVTLKEVTFEDCTASVGGAIFNITSTAGENNEPAVVTLNGNTLFKGCTASGQLAGAIMNQGTLTHSGDTSIKFVNCSAESGAGGAIYNTKTVTLDNATFTDCKSSRQGGAIYNSGTLTLKNDANKEHTSGATFTRCSVTTAGISQGGAIYNSGTIKDNSDDDKISFVSCTSGGSGGAIYNAGSNVTLKKVIFSQCKAGKQGGAIASVDGEVVLDNSSFSNCSVTESGGTGGAIYNIGTSLKFNSNNKLIFDSCTSKGGAGAIYSNSDLDLENASFTGCTAQGNAGAVYANKPLTVKNVSFEGCTSSTGNAGAIYSADTLTVKDCTFTRCTAGTNGGAITNAGTGEVTLSDNTFNNCSSVTNGGAVFCTGTGTVTIDNLSFDHCKTTGDNSDGGAICSAGAISQSVADSKLTFSYCTSGGSAGAIWCNQNVTLANTSFTGCTAVTKGGAINVGSTLTIDNITFYNCKATGTYGNGGAIYSTGAISQSAADSKLTFSYCTSGGSAGAIWCNKEVTLAGTRFVSCSAATKGGAINVGSTLTIDNVEFSGCKATGDSSDGGAIYSTGEIKQSNTDSDNKITFKNCSSQGNAGAISCNQNVTLANTTFNQCTAGADGGAICNNATLTLQKVDFKECKATGTGSAGGAIWSGKDVTLADITFTDCSAGKNGGAIYHSANDGTITLSKITFTGCKANGGPSGDDDTGKYGGGAIFSYGIIKQSGTDSTTSTGETKPDIIFENCSATNGSGGAIWNSKTITFDNVQFAGCSASLLGGAVCNDGGTMSITHSSFANCETTTTGKGDGGAIYNGNKVTLEQIDFTECKAAHYGGAIFNKDSDGCTVTIGNTSYTKCSAGASGGAIFSWRIVKQNENTKTTFTECAAKNFGGAVYNHNTGELTLYNTVINGCTSGVSAAINNGGKATLTNATITGCHSSRNKTTGISALDNCGELILVGKVIIRDNTADVVDSDGKVKQYIEQANLMTGGKNSKKVLGTVNASGLTNGSCIGILHVKDTEKYDEPERGVAVNVLVSEATPSNKIEDERKRIAAYFISDQAGYGKMRDANTLLLVTHEHTWKYTVSGTVITAECQQTYPVGVECGVNKIQTIKLDASKSSGVYTGQECTSAVTEKSNGWTVVHKLKTPSIYYEGISGTQYTKSTTPPTNAGHYRASITTVDAGTDNKKATATDDFVITKADATAIEPTAKELEYTGSSQTLVELGKAVHGTGEDAPAAGTMYYRVDGGRWSSNEPKATNVKYNGEEVTSYLVEYYIKGDGNHVDSGSETQPLGSVNVTITPKDVSADMIGLDFASKPYHGGTDITQVVTGTDGSLTFSENRDYTWSGDSVTQHEVGTYTVKINGKGNYKGTASKTWEIEKTEFDSSDYTAAGYTGIYDGKAHTVKVLPADGKNFIDFKVVYSETRDGDYSETPITRTNAGQTEVWYKVSSKRNKQTVPAKLTIKIDPAQIKVQPDADQTKIYGDEDPVFTFKATGMIGDETQESVGISLTKGTNENVGQHSYSVADVANGNYTAVIAENAPKFTITPRVVSLKWSKDALIYNGQRQSVTASVLNKVGDDIFVIEYQNRDTNVNNAIATGAYTAVVTSVGNNNYTIHGAENLAKEWKISYLEADNATLDGIKKVENSDWFASTVKLVPQDGWKISLDGIEWQDEIIVDTNGANTIHYSLKNPDGLITGQKTAEFSVDTCAPTGKVSFKDHKNRTFESILNTISGGYFFADSVDMTISAKDLDTTVNPNKDGSGVAKISYQLADKDAETYDVNGEWKTYDHTVSIEANAKHRIFVKLTDVAGNVTIFNTDNVIVYTNASELSEKTYQKWSGIDLKTGILTNGNSVKSVTVLDANEQEIAIEENQYMIDAAGHLQIKSDYLDTLAPGEYSFEFFYHPLKEQFTGASQGEDATSSIVSVTVKLGEGYVRNISDISKEYNGRKVDAPVFEKNSSKNAVIEYKVAGAADSTYTTIAPRKVGSYVVRVSVAADERVTAASKTAEFSIKKKPVTITLGKVDEKMLTDEPFTLDVTTSSATTPTFTSSNTNVLTVDENTGLVTIKGVGKATITATTPESENFLGGTAQVEIHVVRGPLQNGVLVLQNPGETTVYDGTEHKPEVILSDDTGVIPADEYTVEYENNVNAGKATANVTYGGTKYSVEFTIAKRTAEFTFTDTEFTYDGTAKKPAATVKNLVGKDTCEVTLTENSAKTEANVTGTVYTAEVASISNSNYELPKDVTKKTGSFTIAPKKLTADMLTLAQTNYVLTESNEPSVTYVLKDGAKTLTAGNDYALVKADSEIAPKKCGSYTVKVTGSGNYTGSVEQNYTVTDTIAPTGSIEIGENRWNSLLNQVTFGKFSHETQTVKIIAEDQGGDLDKIYYYVQKVTGDDEALTTSKLADVEWTEITNNGTFTIDPNQKCIIYAKLTDRSGNAPVYLSSEGVVLDDKKPVIGNEIAEGGTYCKEVSFTVGDENLKQVTVDGVVVSANENGYYVLSANDTAERTIVATDKAGNQTEVKIKINKDHTWNEGEITKAPTCTEGGVKTFTCTVSGDTRTQSVPMLGHQYAAPTFAWTGVEMAEATFVCEHDSSHVKKVTVTTEDKGITSKLTKNASGTEQGEITYTATVTLDGKVYTDTKIEKTTLTEEPQTFEEAGSGRVETEVVVKEDVPTAKIEGLTVEAAKNLLTETDKKQITEDGQDVKVKLEVTNIDEKIEEKEKESITTVIDVIKDAVVKASETLTNKVEVRSEIQYIDISLYKSINNENPEKIHDTGDNNITITISVPDNFWSENVERQYQIIRLHDGVAEVLPTVCDRETQTLTFKTNKFSTYALSYTEPNGIVAPVSINISAASETRTLTAVGESIQLTAVVTPDNATDKRITWQSSDPNVATVDENGKVTAVGNGTAVITAISSVKEVTANVVITVNITEPVKVKNKKPSKKEMKKYSAILVSSSSATWNKKNQLKVTWGRLEEADGYELYLRQCDGKSILKSLVYTAKKNTKTSVLLKKLNGKKFNDQINYKYQVRAYKFINDKKIYIAKTLTYHFIGQNNMLNTNPKSVSVKKSKFTLKVGKSKKITATVNKEISYRTIMLHDALVRYVSSDESIATVDKDGKVTAKKKGTCEIYCVALNGKNKAVTVKVK